jgi:hypothetical protein
MPPDGGPSRRLGPAAGFREAAGAARLPRRAARLPPGQLLRPPARPQDLRLPVLRRSERAALRDGRPGGGGAGPKGLVGPGLLAHLVTCKYADHLPLGTSSPCLGGRLQSRVALTRLASVRTAPGGASHVPAVPVSRSRDPPRTGFVPRPGAGPTGPVAEQATPRKDATAPSRSRRGPHFTSQELPHDP